jgi:hypothetical protein
MGIDARTPVPTTAGWLPAKLLKPGDEVFTYKGLPVKIVSVHEYTPVGCYKIWMKDGLTLVVDGRTGIPAYNKKTFFHLAVWNRTTYRQVTDLDIYAPQNICNIDTGWTRLPTCYPLELSAKPLPVDPYRFGQWAGNPFRKFDKEINAILAKSYGKTPDHIPEDYLFSSFEQRLAVLRGVCNVRKKCQSKVSGRFRFKMNNFSMFRSLHNLAESLGIRAEIEKRGDSYYMKFATTLHLIENQIKVTRPQYWEVRHATHVTEVDIRPCVHIKTEDPNNTVLVSEGYLTVCL